MFTCVSVCVRERVILRVRLLDMAEAIVGGFKPGFGPEGFDWLAYILSDQHSDEECDGDGDQPQQKRRHKWHNMGLDEGVTLRRLETTYFKE